MAAFVLPALFANDDTFAGWIGISVLLFLVSILVGMYRARIIYAKRIDDNEIRLGGCGDDFLDSLNPY